MITDFVYYVKVLLYPQYQKDTIYSKIFLTWHLTFHCFQFEIEFEYSVGRGVVFSLLASTSFSGFLLYCVFSFHH